MSTDTLILIGAVGLGLGILAIWLVLSRRKSFQDSGPRPNAAGAGAAGGDLPASPASEAIEDLVKQKLAKTPGLENIQIDFATAPDGSLAIWIGSDRYGSVEEIRDPRIREAVREAVAAFNR